MATTTRVDGGRDLASEVRAWIARTWDPRMLVRDWWIQLYEAGYAFPTWPVGLGGRGLSAAEARVISHEIGAAHVVGPPNGHLAATLAAPTIFAHGTPEQIARLVPPIARGEHSWCQLFSEPGSGSDLASVGTRAVLDGDEWIVTGQKVWNSAADAAQMGMLLARTDVDVPKHRGMSYFVIEMDQPGIEVRPLKTMNGTAPFCEVFLTEARVPADNLIGALGEGWSVAQTTLAAERSNLSGRGAAGVVVGHSGSADLDMTVGELVERNRAASKRSSRIAGGAVPAKLMIQIAKDHGVSQEPVVRQELARYFTQTRVNAWTNQRITEARGRLTGSDGSISKLTTSRICQQSRDLSFSIVGAAGMLFGDDAPFGGDLHRIGLASPGNRLGGGTDEIQLNVLAERGLGLPREPGSDKDVPYRELRVGTQRGGD